ncbi:MAG: PadR family transcriptional regulator [Treponema sp.]|jgi:DNA-binding PadR family transcriptional regulator|nr:PadR family transcriptional regulator [Treponema sp.]
MSLKYGLLGLLNYRKMSGYDLDKVFKDSLAFFWQGQTSQIYRELTAMEKSGWITSEIEFQTDKPNKKWYTLTPDGKEEFMNWLASPEGAVENLLHVRSSFLMRLFFAGELPPEHTAAMLQNVRNACAKALEDMTPVPGNVDTYQKMIPDAERAGYWRMVVFFGESYYQAIAQWADSMLSLLEKQTEKGKKK